jgi:CRP-like cAMP-binding protein
MLETIQESELFRGVSARVLSEIAAGSEEMTFSKGETVFKKGDRSDDVYELVEGNIDLVVLEHETVRVTVGRGARIFGWSALVEPYERTVTARCASDIRVIRIPRTAIEGTIERHPHEGTVILKNLMRVMADRLRVAYSYIYDYSR